MSRGYRMTELSGAEALWLLEGARGGRLAYADRGTVAVRPAVHVLEYGGLIVRAPAPARAIARAGDATYHCDTFHRATGRGWSVTATGPAHALTNPHEVTHHRRTLPGWIHGPHDILLRIHPLTVQGHRLFGPAHADAPVDDDNGLGAR